MILVATACRYTFSFLNVPFSNTQNKSVHIPITSYPGTLKNHPSCHSKIHIPKLENHTDLLYTNFSNHVVGNLWSLSHNIVSALYPQFPTYCLCIFHTKPYPKLHLMISLAIVLFGLGVQTTNTNKTYLIYGGFLKWGYP